MTVAKEMNNGVVLLLERMKTNPEEFVPNNGSSKWGSLIASYKEFLEPEDRQALSEGVNKLLQQAFTEKVLEELVDPKKSDKWVSQTFTSNTPLGGQTLTASTQAHIQLHQQQLTIQAAQQRTGLGYGAGAQNLLKNIFGSNK
jgi:hypothetical protein